MCLPPPPGALERMEDISHLRGARRCVATGELVPVLMQLAQAVQAVNRYKTVTIPQAGGRWGVEGNLPTWSGKASLRGPSFS